MNRIGANVGRRRDGSEIILGITNDFFRVFRAHERGNESWFPGNCPVLLRRTAIGLRVGLRRNTYFGPPWGTALGKIKLIFFVRQSLCVGPH